MAIEKRWPAVAPVAFTATGGVRGKATITSTRGFKVKQTVLLVHSSLAESLILEVKRVTGRFTLTLGPKGKIDDFVNLSAYDTSTILYADEQIRSFPTDKEIATAVYEQEPTVANRVIHVDQFGDYYGTENPLPVVLTDGSINIDTLNAQLEVRLSHIQDAGNSPADSVRIGNGTNEMSVNGDGSINVNIIESTIIVIPGMTVSHEEISAIPSGIETTLISVVAPPGDARIIKIEVSGENFALFRVKLNGSTIFSKRTWWTQFNTDFRFEDFLRGLIVPAGSILTVTVLHSRPAPGNFEVTVLSE